MRRNFVAICALLGLSVAASAQTSGDALKAAAQPYADCLFRAADELDDGTSDASTIALAVSASCNREFEDSLRPLGDKLPFGGPREMFTQKERDKRPADAARVVLIVRAIKRDAEAKRKSAVPPPDLR